MPLKTHLDDEPTLNLTAMLDVMFLLIIFFMLGTRFIDDERKIGLRVPEVVDRGTLTAAPARREVNVYPRRHDHLGQEAGDARRTDHAAGRRPAAIQRSGRAGARRRPGRVPERRLRVDGLQTGGHPRPGHHRSIDAVEEIGRSNHACNSDRLIESLAGIEPVMAMFWLGLALFTAGLAVLMYTRWGQYRPLRKCMGLSLLAHWCWPATPRRSTSPRRSRRRPSDHTGLDRRRPGREGRRRRGVADLGDANGQPWEVFPDDAAAQPKDAEFERGKIDPPVEPKRLVRAEEHGCPAIPRSITWR